ncbi:hypothetical protein GGR53DRAFT_530973 [Hypoxylon sp. FL1150]|nr:hypothetical protein GGR53DRAFT_530973 [Hypoxylon sp. FL1150]
MSVSHEKIPSLEGTAGNQMPCLQEENPIDADLSLLLSLPGEMRNTIYEYCLVKGTIFMPKGAFTDKVKYKRKYTRGARIDATRSERYKDIPEDWGALYKAKKRIGLICGVSKQVQAEALYVFYGRNRFVLPYGYWTITNVMVSSGPPLSRPDRSEPWNLISRYIRDLSITYDTRSDDLASRSTAMLTPSRSRVLSAVEGNGSVADKPEFWREAHDLGVSRVAYAWMRYSWHFQHMQLDRLQLCFRECFCPMGCCRLARRALDDLARYSAYPGSWRHPFPREVEVAGWWDEAEREAIQEVLRGVFARSDRPVAITFVGEEIAGRLLARGWDTD